MKEQIIEVLKQFEQRDYKTGGVSLAPEMYNAIAESIVKLFAIPDVSGLACNCIGMTEVHQINDKFLCGTYGKPLRQACR